DAEREIVGNRPEHAREAHEQHRRAEEPDRQIGRNVAQLVRILADPLVGINAQLVAARGEPESATRDHPELQQIARQAFAKSELESLRYPALRDVENEKARDDREVDAELIEELVQVAPCERVVERLIPV